MSSSVNQVEVMWVCVGLVPESQKRRGKYSPSPVTRMVTGSPPLWSSAVRGLFRSPMTLTLWWYYEILWYFFLYEVIGLLVIRFDDNNVWFWLLSFR